MPEKLYLQKQVIDTYDSCVVTTVKENDFDELYIHRDKVMEMLANLYNDAEEQSCFFKLESWIKDKYPELIEGGEE